MDEQTNKHHKERRSGTKKEKKDLAGKKKRGIELQPNRGNNPKAFLGRTALSRKSVKAHRSVEMKEMQMHMPEKDRTFALVRDPPLLVAVVGPPGCGKSTLIRSMLRFYAHRNVRDIRGPVTVVAGRFRRITFVECPNTLEAMCDMAKVADLILLVVDGHFGFEMETFEFLTISQIHGQPKIIGIVTHLDKLNNTKQLKKTKRLMRHRFWHEVSPGAKLLCLAPIHHGAYRSADVLKLHRLLIAAEPKIQQWRNTHSCLLIDRHEDITEPEKISVDPNCDRTIAVYGYVRGHPMKPDQQVHIPGLGDFTVQHLAVQPDPCTPFEKGASTKQNRMRHLSAKHKQMYAPYCDANGLGFDDKAVYLRQDPEREQIQRSGEGLDMLRKLQQGGGGFDEQMRTAPMAVAEGRRPVLFSADDESGHVVVGGGRGGGKGGDRDVPPSPESSDISDDDDDGGMAAFRHLDGGAGGAYDDDEAAGGPDDGDELAPRKPHGLDTCRVHTRAGPDWHDEALRRALKSLFVTGQAAGAETDAADAAQGGGEQEQDEMDPYGDKGYESLDDDEDVAGDGDGESATPKLIRAKKSSTGGAAAKKGKARTQTAADDDDAGHQYHDGQVEHSHDVQGLLDFFVSQRYQETQPSFDDGAAAMAAAASTASVSRLDKKGGGAASAGGSRTSHLGALAGLSHGFEASAGGEDDDDASGRSGDESGGEATSRIQKKKKPSTDEDDYMKLKLEKKKAFDDSYDADGGKNTTTAHYFHLLEKEREVKTRLDDALSVVGEDVEKRIALVGFFSGLYVRFVLRKVPVEFTQNFDPNVPLVAGGINAGEDRQGIVQARLKRHRWYPRILKNQDPLILSIGWRRIQVQPLFAIEDPNGRHRYLKYTPQHMHCLACFYGPTMPPNTGFVVIPSRAAAIQTKGFRCAATGYTVAMDATSTVVKKLKLTGTPDTIQKTTVFVKDMFSSDIEAAKFVGAKVKSVSGLRGMIKKALKGKGGLVRCTFEDKLLISDIVFLRAWKPVDPPRYCENVLNLLVPNGLWSGMRAMAALRRELNVAPRPKPDSEYREIVRRADKIFDDPASSKVLLSRSTKIALPFDMKEEYVAFQQPSDLHRDIRTEATVAPEAREQRTRALLSYFKEKEEKMDEKRRETRAANRIKTSRDHQKDEAEQERRLKKAKKETARKVEFRSQHKSRK